MKREIVEFEAKLETESDGSFRIVEYKNERHYIINLLSGEHIVEQRLIPAITHPAVIQQTMKEMTNKALAIVQDAAGNLKIHQSANFSGII